MRRLRAKEKHFWNRRWLPSAKTWGHGAYHQARINAGMFMNPYAEESFLPSHRKQKNPRRDIDAMWKSAPAARGFLGTTASHAAPQTHGNLTQTLSNLGNIENSYLLPRVSPAPGGSF